MVSAPPQQCRLNRISRVQSPSAVSAVPSLVIPAVLDCGYPILNTFVTRHYAAGRTTVFALPAVVAHDDMAAFMFADEPERDQPPADEVDDFFLAVVAVRIAATRGVRPVAKSEAFGIASKHLSASPARLRGTRPHRQCRVSPTFPR